MEKPKFKFMIVDDDSITRRSLKRWFAKTNYEVVLAESGTAAWKILQKEGETFNLVVTDVQMPGMTGFALVDKIRKDKKLKEIPVVFMSAEELSSNAADKAIEQGSHDYLFKPLIRSVFTKKIETIMENTFTKKLVQQHVLHLKRKEKALEQKEQEIGSLKQQLNEISQMRKSALKAVETPIQAITRTVSSLLVGDTFKQMPKVKQQLNDLLVSISKQNLYRPAFENVLSDNKLDSVTKSYLLSEISGGETIKNQIDDNSNTFPHLENVKGNEELQSWGFNSTKLTPEQMLVYLKQMFIHFDLLNRFNINEKRFESFLLAIRDNYYNNPYHNFMHAFDVSQTIFSLLTSMGLAKYFTHVDLFALLISGMCHDLQHPGLNNAHQVNVMSELAIKYNDKSVLENHHCEQTFRLLFKYKITENIPKKEFIEFRKSVIGCILATDMAAHFEYISKLASRKESKKEWNRDEKDDRILLTQLTIKVADISNVAKMWDCSYSWTQFITKEFFQQGDLEKKKGINVAPFMDREKTNMFKNTCNFIDYVAAPFFSSVTQTIPSTSKVYQLVQANRKRWGKLQEEHQKKKESTQSNQTNNKSKQTDTKQSK